MYLISQKILCVLAAWRANMLDRYPRVSPQRIWHLHMGTLNRGSFSRMFWARAHCAYAPSHRGGGGKGRRWKLLYHICICINIWKILFNAGAEAEPTTDREWDNGLARMRSMAVHILKSGTSTECQCLVLKQFWSMTWSLAHALNWLTDCLQQRLTDWVPD